MALTVGDGGVLDGQEGEHDGAGGAGDGDYRAVDDSDDGVDQAANDDVRDRRTLPTQLLEVLAVMGELVVVT